MQYVALLSGGKDSCFNLLHCSKNGHKLVAAASLGPGAGKEELDSYMYQTVGQDAIGFVAEALEVPLYRRVITGTAIQQGSEYGSRHSKDPKSVKGDETEDLFVLLSEVKSKHPEVQGVSVGAILSNYQRIRVEHVCRRLGLTPLSYLWNRDQIELLNEMIESGLEAILIKVAGIGLTTKHLGKTLAHMQPTLLKLNSLYGAHVCGEGGEYESLTLDCPLFKRRIVLTETETVIHSDNDFATVAFLRTKAATLERKDFLLDFKIRIPPNLEGPFRNIPSSFLSDSGSAETTQQQTYTPNEQEVIVEMQSQRSGRWVSVCNVQRSLGEPISLEEEVQECFQKLEAKLAEYSLDLSHCANINILLSSMKLFSAVNAVYTTFFGSGPPSRACVAVDLPSPIRVRLDCMAFEETPSLRRSSLHVQGLSYWAPANIGPYSQAISAAQNIFISGQIGLIPASLTLPSPRSLAKEAALALQHVHRVLNVLKQSSGSECHELLALYWLSEPSSISRVKEAHRQWPEPRTPTLFLAVKSLPKDALIEKQVQVHTGLVEYKDEDGEIELRPMSPSFERRRVNELLLVEQISIPGATERCMIACGKGDAALQGLSAVVEQHVVRPLSVRLFYAVSATCSLKMISERAFETQVPPTTLIPCRRISTLYTDDWDFALCILQM